jgi:hypothetical protein
MIQKLRNLWLKLAGLFRHPIAAPLPEPAQVPLLLPPPPALALPIPPAPKAAPRKKIEAQTPGEFTFRTSLLPTLDLYFSYAKRIKIADPDAYALYRKIGAHIMAYEEMRAVVEHDRLSPWFMETRPTFGAAAIMSPTTETHEKKADLIYAKFLYFKKFRTSPSHVQQHNMGEVYMVTIYWDTFSHDILKAPFASDFACAILPDGEIVPLRVRHTDYQTVHHKHGGKGTSTISHQRWGLPQWLQDYAEERKTSAISLIKYIFCRVTQECEASQHSMVRVTATKGGITAAFGVSATRTPYFFKDREKSGKRIFHIRRTHMRTLPSGKIVPVRMSFAGERRFRWKGYDVLVSVPGVHHSSLTDMKDGFLYRDDENEPIPDGMADMETMGSLIADKIGIAAE